MLTLKIDQIAICPVDPEAANELLQAMGATEWARDRVAAHGVVFERPARSAADLSYNYQLGAPREFEILHYVEGPNWMSGREPAVSHLGMHCADEEELAAWKEFFGARRIKIAQELLTDSHTNPAIAGKRRYHYCIFSTRHILGVDLKFIVRHEHAARPEHLNGQA